MKCKTCKAEFYPTTYETYYDQGKKYHAYSCGYCGEDNLYEVKVHRHINKTRVSELVSEVMFAASVYVFSHFEIFATTLGK